MRPIALLTPVLVAAMLPGCAFLDGGQESAVKAEDGAADPPPTPPSQASPTPPPAQPTPRPAAPAPSSNATGPEANTTASGPNATAPAPNATQAEDPGVLVFNGTFDFSSGQALVPFSASDSFEVSEGYDKVVVTVAFTETGTQPVVTRDCSVSLTTPVMPVPVASVQGQAGGGGTMAATAVPGTWTLRYEGQCALQAAIAAHLTPL